MTPAERELLLALADRLILGLHNDAAKIRILAALDGAGLPTEALVAVLKGEAVIVPKEPTNRMMALGGPEVRKAARLDPGDGNMQTIWGEFEKEFSVIVKRLVSTERELQALKCRVPKEKSR